MEVAVEVEVAVCDVGDDCNEVGAGGLVGCCASGCGRGRGEA
jgi:hypothetical protein